MVEPQAFVCGQRPPLLIGATAGGRFVSPDSQAGQTTVYVTLGLGDREVVLERLRTVAPVIEGLKGLGFDVVPLTSQSRDASAVVHELGLGSDLVVHLADSLPLITLEVRDAIGFAVVDPSGRVIHVGAFETAETLVDVCLSLKADVVREPPARRGAAAPVLFVPNLLTPEERRWLINHFEASPHKPGMMAGLGAEGEAGARYDEDKKSRRDLELTPGEAAHTRLLEVLATGCAPEIKRAFNCDIAFADRILIARYDEAGGYFKRHRDNVAPQTRFRDFAVSINLNTGEYDGGELRFAEYDDHLYCPPAGGAAIFSASLLHEALPVTKGRRYVVLSFLSTAASAAQAQAA